jgi:NADPH:quinone reductase-like Zn-dependent oxidoreductase
MKAIVRSRYGGPEVLRLEDVPVPVPGADDVLVRVIASSVTTADVDYLRGRPAFARMASKTDGMRAPTNPGLGMDVAGTVEAVGRNVVAFHPGDAVIGDLTEHGFGAFAEFACAPASAFARKPDTLSFEQAATLPHAAVLAVQALGSGRRIEPGDAVLVNGASGSVGPFAVQIAKCLGAEVTGVCSTAKVEMVRSLGADHVIDYATEDFTKSGRRYDRIVDMAARRSILACRRALRPNGTYVWVGGPTAGLVQNLVLGPILSLAGSRTLGLLNWRPFWRDDVAYLLQLVESGRVVPVIDRRFPLSDVRAALEYLEDGRARGKVSITVAP